MKDLDFDELDKAVNSLMAGVKSDAPAASSDEKTLTITPSSTSSPARPSSAPLPRPVSPAANQPTPANRRGGRFMDVVHPSSDMKKPESPRPSREGVAIEPRKEANFAAAASEPVETSALQTESSAETAKETLPVTPTVQPHHETGDWPDPLDMAPVKADEPAPSETKLDQEDTPEDAMAASPWSEAETTAKNEAEKASEPEPIAEPEEKPADDAPLTSPFLPGTKVEKRPLGANATAVDAPDDLLAVDENAQLPAMPKDVEPVLPAELHGDVMAIEADTTTKQASSEKPALTEDDSPWQKPEANEKTPASLKPEGPAPAEVKREEPKITGPTSIAQQYHEEPSTGDQKNGAIYDTDSYHQPLAHPAKKKSGWMWIVWILLIVIVGAAVGAALYFLKLV